MERRCGQCGIPIKRRKFCSETCWGLELKARLKAGILKLPSRKGQRATEETRRRMSAGIKAAVPRGERHCNWKGDEISRKAVHDWVYTTLGRPQRCEHCGTTQGRMDWANKSQEYKRDKDDWLRLCRKCHMAFDNTGQTIWKIRRERYGPTGHRTKAA